MFFSMAAMQINIVTRTWLAYHISGSALALGGVALARGLPQLILSPIAGVAADRFDKRKLIILSQSCLCALALANALLVHLGIVQIWHLIAIGMVQGIAFPFTMPVRQAYIPELVDKDQLPNALAMDASGRNANRVLAPSLAGLLIAWHPTAAFYMVTFLYLGAMITLFYLPSSKPSTASQKSALQDMMAGFRYITGNQLLLILMLMSFVAIVLGMPFQHLLPVFQADVLKVGPSELGFMYTAVGIGALFGSLIVAYGSDDPRKGLFQIAAGIGFGVSLVIFAISSTYWLSLALLVIVGFASQGYLTLTRMLVLLNTDKEMYGRVMGVYMMTWSLLPVSMLPLGALVDAVGAPVAVAAAGTLLALFIIIFASIRPSIWHKDEKRV
jgi:MFS family permease